MIDEETREAAARIARAMDIIANGSRVSIEGNSPTSDIGVISAAAANGYSIERADNAPSAPEVIRTGVSQAYPLPQKFEEVK